MVVVGRYRLDCLCEWQQMTLVEDRLYKLWENEHSLNVTCDATYVTLQLLVPNIRLHAHQVSQHASHDILSHDDNLLTKTLDATGVRRKVDLGQPCFKTPGE
jgi:hypothetical protein